jgi:hypothetical protein
MKGKMKEESAGSPRHLDHRELSPPTSSISPRRRSLLATAVHPFPSNQTSVPSPCCAAPPQPCTAGVLLCTVNLPCPCRCCKPAASLCLIRRSPAIDAITSVIMPLLAAVQEKKKEELKAEKKRKA